MTQSDYPESTSHLRKWIAPSLSEYRRVEKVFYERSLRNLIVGKASLTGDEAQQLAQTCPLTLAKQAEVLVWFIRSLLDIMMAHQFDFRVADTTLAFYRRFYLRECVVRYPPNLYLFTAMIVAIKCENAVIENRCPSRLFSGTGKATVFHEALEFEGTLSQTLQFDFFVLHGDAPITYYINSYYGYRKKNNRLTVPTVGWAGPKQKAAKKEKQADNEDEEDKAIDPAQLEEQIFVEWLSALQHSCEKIYLQLYAGESHFVFRPAEVAAGVFVHVTKITYALTDIDEFLPSVLPHKVRGDAEMTQKLLRLIQVTAHEAYKQEQAMAKYDTDFWRPKIQEYLKEARKWTRQLERKRKLGSEDNAMEEPPTKRSKND